MAYIGRSGWNDLAFGAAIPDEEILEAVDESYRLIVSKLESPPTHYLVQYVPTDAEAWASLTAMRREEGTPAIQIYPE